MNIGDLVKIDRKSEFYGQSMEIGKISNFRDSEQWVWVIFPDGYSNAYREQDLVTVLTKILPEPEFSLEEIGEAENLVAYGSH